MFGTRSRGVNVGIFFVHFLQTPCTPSHRFAIGTGPSCDEIVRGGRRSGTKLSSADPPHRSAGGDDCATNSERETQNEKPTSQDKKLTCLGSGEVAAFRLGRCDLSFFGSRPCFLSPVLKFCTYPALQPFSVGVKLHTVCTLILLRR